jgi:uroporphyrin-III C-methyltransferase
MRQVSERLGHVESQMATSQQQQLSLEALYKDLSQGRDQWTLAEIEQVLLTAAQQLQLAGNVKAAIIALEGADTRLQRLNKPQFTACAGRSRPTSAGCGRCLRSTKWAPARASRRWSRAMPAGRSPARRRPKRRGAARQRSRDRRPPGAVGRAQAAGADPPHRGQRGGVAAAGPGLLPARESAPAAAVGAAGAAVAGSGGVPADLRAVSQMLTRYFNTRDAGVVAALKEIERLSSLQITQTLPGIDASLAALEAHKGNP